MTRAVVGASCLFVASCMAFGQSAAGPPTFEVASVKPADPGSHMGSDLRMSPGGTLTITNLAPKYIILKAFDVKYSQVSGGPGWLDTAEFNIVAKAEGNPSQAQMMAMLRTLLADRFQLKVHRETKEGNAGCGEEWSQAQRADRRPVMGCGDSDHSTGQTGGELCPAGQEDIDGSVCRRAI
jgi:Protein of unknown function (DUF3738)